MIRWLYSLFNRDPLGGLRSPEWNNVRRAFLLLCPTCACCGTKKKLEVHHQIPFHEQPALELDQYNLITLCRDCHFFVGHLKNFKSYNSTVKDDSAYWLKKISTRP